MNPPSSPSASASGSMSRQRKAQPVLAQSKVRSLFLKKRGCDFAWICMTCPFATGLPFFPRQQFPIVIIASSIVRVLPFPIIETSTHLPFSSPSNLRTQTHKQLEVEEDEAFTRRLAARDEGSNRQEQQQRRVVLEQENRALTVRLNNELEDVRYVWKVDLCWLG